MTREMSLSKFNKSLQETVARKGVPIFGGFELTPRCNLGCKTCFIKNKCQEGNNARDELSTKQWIELGKAAADYGTLSVFLTGGEPLMRNDFKEIYEAFNRLGLRLNIITNGTLITEEFARWLSQMPPYKVDVTLFGASGQTYLDFCGQKEAYTKARKGIELLLKYQINTRIKTNIVSTNKNDYNKLKDIANSLGLEFISSNIIHGNTVDEIICTADSSSFFINWEGDMVPSALFDLPNVKTLTIGFDGAWDMLREGMKFSHEVLDRSAEHRAFCHVYPEDYSWIQTNLMD